MGVRGPVFISRLRQGFLCLIVCFVGVFIFCPEIHNLFQKFAIPFAVLIYLVYSTYCKILTDHKSIKIQT